MAAGAAGTTAVSAEGAAPTLGRPPFPRPPVAEGMSDWLTTTDHKKIGLLYIVTAFGLFAVGGLLALLMRLELAQPGLQYVGPETYNELFTMHGTVMMLLFATPMIAGFANYLVPLQVGAADMAFARFNALSYWLFLFGSLIVLSGFLTVGGAANAGWTGYAPLSTRAYSPSAGMDLWIVGLALTGLASIFGAINFIATIFTRRAPGMTMLRLPIFSWAVLVTSVLILFAFPSLTAALAMLYIDRHFGGGFFDPAAGGDPILYQHLFWFFGHPEVYIVILPFFGVVSEIIPVFSRKPLFGYRLMIFSLVLIAAYSFSVWAHHMFTTGAVDLPFFSIMSFLIAVPTGIKFFNWIATMWRGQLSFPPPMLWAVGMLYVFLIGGITGVIIASPPLDFHVHDTYFVVGHMHNVLVGGTAFAMFAGFYFWFPKATGRSLSERLGRLHFWLFLIGFTLTFVPHHQLGVEGMPRRFADYPAVAGWPEMNLLSSLGALISALGVLVFTLAVVGALRRPPDAPDDPWLANSLEWATSSPPPHHNFRWLPPIRSERPVWDERMRRAGRLDKLTEREDGRDA
ncbi:MAG: cytochrome c oxidase subunit I [Chloroflexota bacterium]|nr:cytochrome c oxidase subunit I [Chloroflexota bacterium]